MESYFYKERWGVSDLLPLLIELKYSCKENVPRLDAISKYRPGKLRLDLVCALFKAFDLYEDHLQMAVDAILDGSFLRDRSLEMYADHWANLPIGRKEDLEQYYVYLMGYRERLQTVFGYGSSWIDVNKGGAKAYRYANDLNDSFLEKIEGLDQILGFLIQPQAVKAYFSKAELVAKYGLSSACILDADVDCM